MARMDEVAQALRALRDARENIQEDVSTDARVQQGQAKALARVDEVIAEYEEVLRVEQQIEREQRQSYLTPLRLSRTAQGRDNDRAIDTFYRGRL
jgi:uncharacterized membrane protein YccC